MRHGSRIDPPNRFESIRRESDLEQVIWDEDFLEDFANRPLECFVDASETIVTENSSPDIPFRYSINHYRGCEHGCAYCYARPTHEYLGLNAGLDFETRLFVKPNAPSLLEEFLRRPNWVPEQIVMCGVTDPYQPIERNFQLTRQCLQVACKFSQPVSIITKNALVTRDLDLLIHLSRQSLVSVNLSITTLDVELARSMEPRTSTPVARLRAIQQLSDAGVPVRVMFAPVIPGLNDHEAHDVLSQAREAGAIDARYTMLRLPHTVEPVFLEWLERERPLARKKVISAIQSIRGGRLNDSAWGERMIGSGVKAEQFAQMFSIFRRKLGFQDLPPLDATKFHVPAPATGQLWLFD